MFIKINNDLKKFKVRLLTAIRQEIAGEVINEPFSFFTEGHVFSIDEVVSDVNDIGQMRLKLKDDDDHRLDISFYMDDLNRRYEFITQAQLE